jgi:SAM-dependent methyltransferase
LVLDTTSDSCARIQEGAGRRLYDDYLRPWLGRAGAQRVLDAGCGIGLGVAAMRADGLEAVGLDVASVAARWAQLDHDAEGFVVGDLGRLPVQTGTFDAVLALGVIEHLGTTTGHLTLAPGWWQARERFCSELARVTRPGGRILVACPNRRFPLDVQHGPNDGQTNAPRRAWLFERTGINVHPTWGPYHLASYGDLRRWFRPRPVRPLPLAGYFGFSSLERAGLPPLAGRLLGAALAFLPGPLLGTALNPYVLAEVEV